MELSDLKSYVKLEKECSPLKTKIDELVKLVKPILNGISGCHKNYTMHDIQHSFRVAAYMEQLAFGLEYEKIDKFNNLELSLIVFSAILHDIGMYFSNKDVEEIKNNNFTSRGKLIYEGVLNANKGDEEETIREIVRISHAERVEKFIKEDDINKCLEINNYSFANEVTDICKAHGEDKKFVASLSKNYTISKYDINIQYIAELLRIADYLDLDKERTPILWYKLVGPTGYSNSEWNKHFMIQNEKKLEYVNGTKIQIYFNGKSEDAKIHRSFLRYIDDLKQEVEFADSVLNIQEQKEKYNLNICTKIDNKVDTIGFTYSDLRLSLNYSAITELLMGKNIYGDNKYGLRELIQNSIDACKLMAEIAKTKVEYADYEPMIKISISNNKGYVKIIDNGIGMSLETIKKHFLNIGNSYYASREFGFNNYNYKPIGQFGIGFLACFLLSQSVKVKSKKYDDSQINAIELEKNSEYVVTKIDANNMGFSGTEIALDYQSFFKTFKTIETLIGFLEDTFFSNIKICIHNVDTNDVHTIKNSKEKMNGFFNAYKDEYLHRISLQDYSQKIEGVLFINSISTNPEKNIDFNNSYFYFESEKKFVQIKSHDKLNNNIYRLMPYADFNNEELLNLQKEKNREGFKKTIFALAKKESRLKYFFIERKFISFTERDDDDFFSQDLLVDNIHISQHIENLGFHYYPQIDNWLEPPIFIYKNKYVKLCLARIDNRVVYSRMNDDEPSCSIYSKDVLVPDSRHIMLLPLNIQYGAALINNKNIELGLDVSRHRIIKGNKIFQRELATTILKYLVNNSSEKIKHYIEHYIKYLQEYTSDENSH